MSEPTVEYNHDELDDEQVETNRGPVPTNPPIAPAPKVHPSEFPNGRRGTMPGVEIRGERK